MTQLSLLDGMRARDEAIERIEENAPSFIALGTVEIAKLPKGFEYTGEDIRLELEKKGLKPHHPNAWGALIMNAVRMKLLRNTERTAKMRVKTSHARRTSIYVRE